ncbi:hypothetical protein [Providencia sp. Je.9.19]|uniref:hypothetical protein n=1 Tax=Providencia sp. Je.9.19 TaxID=3142844 RepID=UPI003DA860CA
MSDGVIIFFIVWALGVLFFSNAIVWHYERQPADRLPMWATILIIIFWFIALPLALLILSVMRIDFTYFSDED